MSTRLEIQIGKQLSTIERAQRIIVTFGAVLAIPMVNHHLMGGSWVMDLIGALLGFAASYALFRSSGPHSKTFETQDEAAAWVRSVELSKEDGV